MNELRSIREFESHALKEAVLVNSRIEAVHVANNGILPVRLRGGARLQNPVRLSEPGKPLVTLITSTYNAAKHFPAAVMSIREQTYDNLEWIVVDGGSKDGTVDILRQNEDVIDYWVSEPDKGIYDAWNKGLQSAHGDWILFLGADDRLLPDAIESLVGVANESPAPLDLISGKAQLQSGTVQRRAIGRPWTWGRFRRYMCVAHVGAMHNASFFKRYGPFDSTFRIAGDYELLLRAGSTLKAGFVNKVLVRMEMGGISNRDTTVFRETFRARLKHGATTRFAGAVGAAWAWFKWNIRRLIKY